MHVFAQYGHIITNYVSLVHVLPYMSGNPHREPSNGTLYRQIKVANGYAHVHITTYEPKISVDAKFQSHISLFMVFISFLL
jgi:hypothetical protein